MAPGLLLFLVLAVGALSILWARSIWAGNATIRKITRHVKLLENVHRAMHHLVFKLERSMDARTSLLPGLPDGY